MKKITLLFILFVFFYKESVGASGLVSVTTEPKNPKPYEKVTLSLVSYAFDVNVAPTVWLVSGKIFSSGKGNKSIDLTTGPVGVSIPVTVKITTPEGEELDSSFYITPQSVDLVWESLEGYVPPFYEGKILAGEGSSVRVTAFPTVKEDVLLVNPKNLSYLWYINDNFISSSSGAGKQSINFKLDYLSDKTNIKVRVRSAGGQESENKIDIYIQEVVPALYLYDDILGLKRSIRLDKRFEAGGDFNLSLVPYYLSTRGTASGGESYDWLLNGLSVTPTEKTLLTFRPKDNSFGEKKLSIFVENTKRRLQKAETSLSIMFDTRK